MYLTAADLAIQIRTNSRGETSAAVMDCMNHALPVIVNANGSMAELDHEAVFKLPDEFEDDMLIDAMETLWRDVAQRRSLGEKGREIIVNRHAPAECARLYASAIEHFYERAKTSTPALINAIASQKDVYPDNLDLLRLAKAINATLPLLTPVKRLLLDVTATFRNDLKTGIERVTRAISVALIMSPPSGYRIEPVYLSEHSGQWHYRYARRYTLELLGCPSGVLRDDYVEPECEDILLGLDFSGDILIHAAHSGLFEKYRNRGVFVYFMVHDLLPVRIPEVFPPEADQVHTRWIKEISKLDGAICVSKAVADDFTAWRAEAGIEQKNRRPFYIGWSHHGADFTNTAPSMGLPFNAKKTINRIKARPSFLMVGTIEPRKGHFQSIEAFSRLWQEDIDVNLVIVGKEGWTDLQDTMRRDLPETIKALKRHPERKKHLFWLKNISDEYLEYIYDAGTCLIAASVNEGFGLPLIEAAIHEIPLIVRDIPVFREVAGDGAFYFSGETADDLALAVKTWLKLYENKQHPTSDKMCRLTWAESSEKLKTLLFPKTYPRRQILVDISELVRKDAGSGIQRVVSSILKQWLVQPPRGFRVEPVYAAEDQGYRYARGFTLKMLNLPDISTRSDEPVEYTPGDIFFGLDLQPQVVPAQRSFYQHLRQHGVKVMFLVYDLLCIRMPQHFIPGTAPAFTRWLEVVCENDGAVCISESVAHELGSWITEKYPKGRPDFQIHWSHIGADFGNSIPTKGLPDNAKDVIAQLKRHISFLMVGTIEPRKGHLLVLEAFEELWRRGLDIHLVIVGQKGWMVDSLIEKIESHPEIGKRLFWMEGISDEYLDQIYSVTTCLIAASEGEGFGLPLIEAAWYKIPIIARDIPVFHEVAGEHAFYFNGSRPQDAADAVSDWLDFYRRGKVPKSENIPRLTWRQSADRLLKAIMC